MGVLNGALLGAGSFFFRGPRGYFSRGGQVTGEASGGVVLDGLP